VDSRARTDDLDPPGSTAGVGSRAPLEMEPHRLVLRCGEDIVCELLGVVRAHHDTMPGPARDRPGWDRVILRLPSGDEVVADLWSSGDQDIRRAPRVVQLFDGGEVIGWRPVVATAPRPEPANDDPSLKLVG
jgi:hypothetical protein